MDTSTMMKLMLLVSFTCGLLLSVKAQDWGGGYGAGSYGGYPSWGGGHGGHGGHGHGVGGWGHGGGWGGGGGGWGRNCRCARYCRWNERPRGVCQAYIYPPLRRCCRSSRRPYY